MKFFIILLGLASTHFVESGAVANYTAPTKLLEYEGTGANDTDTLVKRNSTRYIGKRDWAGKTYISCDTLKAKLGYLGGRTSALARRAWGIPGVPGNVGVISQAEVFCGFGTYYKTGMGACGGVSKDTDLIVALNSVQYGNHWPNPNKAECCGRCVLIRNETGKTVKARVVDKCPECVHGDLDLSPEAFKALSDLSVGRMKILWEFVSC
ncbi:hypothetical protein BB559_004150 [Furculomyces boomerangus]|uniref:Barwin domain-containing protein n=2 Tax=Harpellales TaxID=61421 RepID=A0A2T9YGD5_9FUNG|nr:hypothetical protein BB559_004150 [Furculomyces boomerangus]PVZ98546.1 hypothetical protein BB558_005459 [Smittium angustum]